MTDAVRHDVIVDGIPLYGVTVFELIECFNQTRETEYCEVRFLDPLNVKNHYRICHAHRDGKKYNCVSLMIDSYYVLHLYMGNSEKNTSEVCNGLMNGFVHGGTGEIDLVSTGINYNNIVDHPDVSSILGVVAIGAWRVVDDIIEVSSPELAMQLRMMV